jgi:deoxyribodipyrimidine photo-lyase
MIMSGNLFHSPYLAAGVISARECIRATLGLLGTKKVQANRDSGIGMWVQEIGSYLCHSFGFSLVHIRLAWRDFYTHVLAAFPRVSMGRPFNEKYAVIQWETNPEYLEAWRAGRTGVPIVDAAMRQANSMGASAHLCLRAKVEYYYRLDAQSRAHDCRNVPH